MINDWLAKSADRYLAQMVAAESISRQGDICSSCSGTGQLYQCRDCLHPWARCKSCVLADHACLPSHRFRKWTGTHFTNIKSEDINYVLHLGHGGNPCTLGKDSNFVLGDVNGLHRICIRTCRHLDRGSTAKQLMEANIFPCTDDTPQTGFTFSVLRMYQLLWTEAKLSSQHFYNVLIYLTDPTFPAKVPNRYREFMRVSHQWQFLQDLKRNGLQTVQEKYWKAGQLALRCPACPRPNFNYWRSDVIENEE